MTTAQKINFYQKLGIFFLAVAALGVMTSASILTFKAIGSANGDLEGASPEIKANGDINP